MIKKAVIPVAGRGTRFYPLTKTLPKEMLPIVDRPIIAYIVEECIKSGIEEIIFITNNKKKIIEDYFTFEDGFELTLKDKALKEYLMEKKLFTNNVKFHYINQDNPQGTAHAIYLAKDLIKDDDFAVLYGDDFMMGDIPVLKQLIDLYQENDASVIAVKEVKLNNVSSYGMIKYDDNKLIKAIVEKPDLSTTPSLDAGLGRYVLKNSIFKEIEILPRGKNSEYQLTDAMSNLMKKEKFVSCKFDGEYYDLGSKVGYLKANLFMALEKEDLKKEILEVVDLLKEENR